jgi:hypothetical protein
MIWGVVITRTIEGRSGRRLGQQQFGFEAKSERFEEWRLRGIKRVKWHKSVCMSVKLSHEMPCAWKTERRKINVVFPIHGWYRRTGLRLCLT